MPSVSPRQIIEAINVMFGPPVNELEPVRHYKQSEVRTLLGLLDQLPSAMITLPFYKYLEFERARAALATILPRWNVGDTTLGPGVGGKNPVAILAHLLAECANELPPPEPEFPFISDEDTRLGIEDRTRAAWIDFNAREWLGATTSAAVALEAVLLWEIKRLRNSAIEDASKKPEKNPDNMVLADLIEEACNQGAISDGAAKQAHLARDARNLIHPGKVARSGTACDKATALAAFAGLYRVASELKSSSRRA
jgi:hypothetical protein